MAGDGLDDFRGDAGLFELDQRAGRGVAHKAAFFDHAGDAFGCEVVPAEVEDVFPCEGELVRPFVDGRKLSAVPFDDVDDGASGGDVCGVSRCAESQEYQDGCEDRG